MASSSRRYLLLGMDGLSGNDIADMLPLLPALWSLMDCGQLVALDARPFSSLQPIWSEILSGSHWYETGCVGYAFPKRSLAELDVYTEKLWPNLFLPLFKSKSKGKKVCINIPLLKPDDQSRVWLAEGGDSSQRLLSPQQLLKEAPFSEYKPRPYSNLADALQRTVESCRAAIAVEQVRLDCSMKLLQDNDWSEFYLRLSVFDQLFHLLGPLFYRDADLQITAEFQSVLRSLNSFVQAAIEKECTIVVVSAFSHTECIARLDLNGLLRAAGLNVISDLVKRDMVDRRQAIEAIAMARGASNYDGSLMVSPESNTDAERSIAISPVLGAVFVNDRDRFVNGAVASDQLSQTILDVERCVQEQIGKRWHGLVSIFRRPAHVAAKTAKGVAVPEWVMWGDGIEFCSSSNTDGYSRDVPKSTHSCEGFAILPVKIATQQKVVPANLRDIIGAL